MRRVVVTGGSGFVGRALLERLSAERDFELSCTVRRDIENPLPGVSYLRVAEAGPDTDWRRAVEGVDAVIHTAARVHVMKNRSADAESQYRRVNVEGTRNLARQAAAAGARRFIFLSSIKVNGESTLPGHPFKASDEPRPLDAYAISKFEAEAVLLEIAAASAMEVVIVRPPLVYGPGVGANFLSLMRWVYRGIPLPLGGIRNQRSLVALDNLTDLLLACTVEEAAANRVALAGDGEDLSTSDLITRVGRALGRPARLFSVPAGVLDGVASMIGKRDVSRRLLDSLQVDIAGTRSLLGWSPVVSVDDALNRTAEYFLSTVR